MLQIVNALLGGLGLFLVGMWLMTDGLKLAAGNALRDLLHTWTNNRYRGLVTGFSITALVQSSSAVTVATIGFANAGLLSLEQAIWVIFGSNVGTTMTGWIVALIGFKINMEAFALPLVGIGMLIRLIGKKSKRAAIGQALVGFGLFFLGIGVLKETFDTIGSSVNLPSVEESGLHAIFLYVLLGMVLTTLMQSSSAAIVITLSAAEGGLIPLSAAAATVIGANLGTTTTAILSVWGATSTAKRVAASHVLFNLITALVALIIIVPMLALVNWLQGLLSLPPAAATTLALFHTTFNVLGVLLMFPIANRLTAHLATKFTSGEELLGKPKYLDKTALEVPALAVTALMNEVRRLTEIVLEITAAAIHADGTETDSFIQNNQDVEQLASAIGNYVAHLSRTELSVKTAEALPEVILNVQQYNTMADLANDIVELQTKINIKEELNEIRGRVNGFKNQAAQILTHAIPATPEYTLPELQQELAVLEEDYDTLKLLVLKAGASGDLTMVTVDALLQQANFIRRIARLALKAAQRQQQITLSLEIGDTMTQQTEK